MQKRELDRESVARAKAEANETQQLLQMLDSGRQTDYMINQQSEQTKILCEAQKQSCYASCKKNDYSCSTRCGFIKCY